ncbi:hypothetical protein WA026_002474 [Henosepilachna vigintioctopunctata]|uniref:Uncharacterized protein n=1 Tax=Henosepilachna vigintioctopunctata TaxID=420089 RepID=A0AAW1TRG4_9CUCU
MKSILIFCSGANYFSVIPHRIERALEYMDIKAERTIYQFVLLAEGIPSSIRIEPSLKVLRVLSKKGKTAEMSFEVKNDSNFPVTLKLEKVCELEGRIISPPPVETEKEIVMKKEKKSKKKRDKSKSSKSSSRKKGKKEMIHSEELKENEIYSIENTFEKNSGEYLKSFSF